MSGASVVSIMLITALLLGVQTTIIGSSRSMYQMTHDGQMIKQFGVINKFGVPVGSMFVDMAVTLVMLVIFQGNVVNLIAASNVGYLTVWLLLLPAYIILRRTQPDAVRTFKLPGYLCPAGPRHHPVQCLPDDCRRAAVGCDAGGDHREIRPPSQL